MRTIETVHFSNISVEVDESALFGLKSLQEQQETIMTSTAKYLKCFWEPDHAATHRQEIVELLENYDHSLRLLKEQIPSLGEVDSLLDEFKVK